MANETTLSTNQMVAAAVDAKIIGPFVSATIMTDIVAPFNPNIPNTTSLKLPKSGSVTASVVTEGSAATPQTVTDTAVTLTIKKAVVVTKPTAEALKFATHTSNERHAALAAIACAQKFDIDALALAAGFSQTADAGTGMTVAKFLEAAYLVRAGNILSSEELDAVLSYKQSFQLAEDIRTSTGSFYGNANFDGARTLDGKNPKKGYKGKLFNVNWWESGNVHVDVAPTPDNYIGMMVVRGAAIAALYAEGSTPGFNTEISDDLGFLESVRFIKTTMWYDLAEYNDLAGVGLVSDI